MSQHKMDAPEHTYNARQCMSKQSFLSPRRAGPLAAAASPELLFYLSPVTSVSPMGHRAGPVMHPGQFPSHRLANYTEPFLLPQNPSIIVGTYSPVILITVHVLCYVSLAGKGGSMHTRESNYILYVPKIGMLLFFVFPSFLLSFSYSHYVGISFLNSVSFLIAV